MTSSDAELGLMSLTVDAFLARLASEQPAPGGGSAAALAGAMASALASMVARLTIGRERYAMNQQQMCDVQDRAEALRRRMTALVEEDARAYREVLKAYGLPKGSETEHDRRAAAIQQALRRASVASLKASETCAEILDLTAEAAALGNRNAAGDAAVAALLAHAGLRGALLNVRINLRQVQNQDFVAAIEAHLGQLFDTGEVGLARALAGADLGDPAIVR
jgi:methenyltetrahydrofolate cyclohydrolase